MENKILNNIFVKIKQRYYLIIGQLIYKKFIYNTF